MVLGSDTLFRSCAIQIQFCLWSGEEQGLYGSTAYAKQLSSTGAKVVAYLNADMISYKVPTEPVQVRICIQITECADLVNTGSY
jgi:hypothetical protein